MKTIITRMRRVVGATVLLALVFAAGVTHAAPRPQAGQSGFEIVDPSTQTERMPAAPLLITAYAFVWVALSGYVWTIWRRIGRVEGELLDLRKRLAERGPAAPRH